MKIQTAWNFELLYKSPDDPQIDKDVQEIIRVCKRFEKKWKGNKVFLKNEKVLLEALKDHDKVLKKLGAHKPLWYFQLLNDNQSNHPVAGARATQISQIITEAGNRTIFFKIDLGAVSKENQKKFLASKILKDYKYHLEKIFRSAKYRLSEPEEKILGSTEIVNYEMWVNGVSKSLSAQKIMWNGKEMGLGEAGSIMWALPRKEREGIYHQIIEVTKAVAPFAEAEINAVLTIKKIEDNLRGYEHPYSSWILGNENDEKAILRLATIVKDHFAIARKFWKIKKDMLGVKGKMRMFDVFADVGKIEKQFSFDDSIEIIRNSFSQVDSEFADIVDNYLQNGQIDVFPKLNKKSGAYCWKHRGLPTFVLLNHVPNFSSVTTFAHEMGHAIHGEFSKQQPIAYENYTISTAEVASTFFENMAFEQVFETLSPKEQIIALHDKIQGSINTIFAQIAFFNFEIELHELVRSTGFVSKEKMSELMKKHRQSYMGEAVEITNDDGLFWVRLSHIRRHFYVYTYAYGELISSVMYANYKKDHSFVKNIKKFLSAGGSDTPERIFKSIGIDTSKDEFWITGLKAVEGDVNKLEKLVKRKKKGT